MSFMKPLLSAFFLLSGSLLAGPILYTVGPNNNGLPNQLVRIDVDATTASTQFTIGGNTRRFGGGLIGGGSTTFGTLETAGGNTIPVGFDSTGQVAPMFVLTIPPEFRGGGMVVGGNPGALFWIENDASGNSLFSLMGLLSVPIGTGFTGGLAYRTTDGKFYALNNSSSGASTLQAFDTNTNGFAPLAIALGSGFTGGLAWDPASDLFYALASDANKNTTLYRFAATDATPTALFSIGNGFEFASLSVATTGSASDPSGDPSQVPEPGTWLMTSAAALALLARRHPRWALKRQS
jgi:hypothetical protein